MLYLCYGLCATVSQGSFCRLPPVLVSSSSLSPFSQCQVSLILFMFSSVLYPLYSNDPLSTSVLVVVPPTCNWDQWLHLGSGAVHSSLSLSTAAVHSRTWTCRLSFLFSASPAS